MMRIKALESVDFSVKGHDTVPLRTGEEIDVPDEIAERIIGHGFAEEALEGEGIEPGDAPGVEDQVNTDDGDDGSDDDSGSGDSDDGDPGDDPDDDGEDDDSPWPDGLTPAAEEALEGEGIEPGQIAGKSDEELLDITNVGPGTVKLLREVFGPPADGQ